MPCRGPSNGHWAGSTTWSRLRPWGVRLSAVWSSAPLSVCLLPHQVPVGSATQVSEAPIFTLLPLSFIFLSAFSFCLTSQFCALLIGSHSNALPMNMIFTYVLANVYFDWMDPYGFNVCKWCCAVYYILAFTLPTQERDCTCRWAGASEYPGCGFPSRSAYLPVLLAPVPGKDPR